MQMSNTQRFLPYEADYDLLLKSRNLKNIGLCVISLVSIILPVLNYFSDNKMIKIIWIIIYCVYFITIIVYYIINVYTETFLYPATARKRRKGFIDNSLGSKFLEKSMEGYYTNDAVNMGPYKMIINCGENCYFTMNIAKAMTRNVVIKNFLFTIAFLVIAYFGIKDNLVAIPMLQVLLSSLFLTELIHHMNFITKLEQLFERFKGILTQNADDSDILQQAVLLLLDYETTLAYNKAPLSNAIYRKLNEKLSAEWEEIKERYNVYE